MRVSPAVPRPIRPSLAALALGLGLAAGARAQDPPPPPELAWGSPCPAVVTLSWDISSVPTATTTRWEFKWGSDFTTAVGNETGAIRGNVDGVVGSVRIDLRDYYRVGDGTRFYFRVAARGSTEANGLPRSSSVVFDWDERPLDFAAEPTPGGDIEVRWNLPPQIAACADRVYWRISSSYPAELASGETATTGTGSAQATLPAGEIAEYVHLQAHHGSLDALAPNGIGESAVGRMTSRSVPVQTAVTVPSPTVSVAGACRGVVDLGWDVSSVPGATGVLWELRRGGASGPGGGEGTGSGSTGSARIDLRDYGPILEGSVYSLRVSARGSPSLEGVPPSRWVRALESTLPAVDVRSLAPVQPLGNFELEWSLTDAVADCADRLVWEVRRSTGGTGPLAAIGTVRVDGTRGTITGRVQSPATGEYYVRVAAFHGGRGEDDRIAISGGDHAVTLVQTTEAPVAVQPDPDPFRRDPDPAPAPRIPPRRLRGPLVEHRFTGRGRAGEVIAYAESRGYASTAMIRAGRICQIDRSSDPVRAGEVIAGIGNETEVPRTVCEFGWLVGKPLAAPWTIEGMRLEVNDIWSNGRTYPNPWLSCRVDSVDSTGRRGIVTTGTHRGSSTTVPGLPLGRDGLCYVVELRLRGPERGDWRDAFE